MNKKSNVQAEGAGAVRCSALVRPTAREIYNETRRNIRYRDKLLRMGASKQTIAKALGINEDSPILAELA